MPKTATAAPADSYMALVRQFPLRPVRSEAALDRATAVIDSLTSRNLDADEREYLDALSDLVWIYEEEHHPIKDLAPREMLAYLIEDRGISQRSLANAAGIPVSTISEILSGKRDFTVAHIERLAGYFGVGPETFMLVPTRKRKSR